ncbi:hemin uptake protein HemP [Wenzhouxiangella sediminis]|uniref:Hemin uptake protein HemP n=1 Tax=Wenzhouxiangella sediminis TaxID=1792836 RepID=A0A3E1KAI5_9GAMM|nr:hemin uptake protein HemP [Wenzhouxiangella sediminis]RFF31362.1 hemin uptake protein HemP [Wenzhouxiangella sediminis]
MRERQPKPSAAPDRREEGSQRAIPVRRLLDENGQARLEHDGDLYLLQVTRKGKLILTK